MVSTHAMNPVYLKEKVFDSATSNPIKDAYIIAVDKTGSAATDVAITDTDGVYELQKEKKRKKGDVGE